ncbi:hypothetical protein IAG44_18775 [Streptomyces roseirectus]|uniref:Fibronectin type-III domain-containing protein n=1 Tax=Streptomyces roseirectus TaxID=2768066 RepID=A0A7H0IER4_9ACTN|nr:hypothetical protein [Streptomyces roseirectus]QNP71280.1 hypothetical protein IAG44_18775 [Streptomyces roseirectus]
MPVLDGGSGELAVVDVRSGHTLRARVPGAGRGTPQLLGKRVYLPDESAGSLLVYDTSLSAPADPVRVTGGGGRLELFVRDGLLWVNDPDGADAAVIDAGGEVRRITKYGPAPRDKAVEGGVPTGGSGASPGPSRAGVASGAVPSGAVPSGVGAIPGPGMPSVNPPSGSPEASGPGPTQPEPGPTQPEPGAPGAPQVESLPGALRVTFAPAAGATPLRYVLKGAAPDQTVTPDEVGPDGPFVFEVEGGSCARQYGFTVVAEYGGGRPGKESAPSALARPCVAPGAPQDLVIVPAQGGHGGTATWREPQGGAVTYTVTGPDGTASTTATTHTYRDLPNGAPHAVSVTASNAAGSGPAAYGTLDLIPPPQRMRIVNNDSDGTLGIRSMAHHLEGRRVGEVPAGQNPEVVVHCKKRGSTITAHEMTTDIWAYLTYQNITGHVSDIWVDSRSNADVWDCA